MVPSSRSGSLKLARVIARYLPIRIIRQLHHTRSESTSLRPPPHARCPMDSRPLCTPPPHGVCTRSARELDTRGRCGLGPVNVRALSHRSRCVRGEHCAPPLLLWLENRRTPPDPSVSSPAAGGELGTMGNAVPSTACLRHTCRLGVQVQTVGDDETDVCIGWVPVLLDGDGRDPSALLRRLQIAQTLDFWRF